MNKAPLTLVPGQLELVRPPAPGQLELVRHFINTLNVEQGTDALAAPDSAAAWLRSYALADKKLRLTPADVAWMREVREALRGLARQNNAIPCPCDLEILDAASARGHLALTFDRDGSSVLRPSASGVDGAIGSILAAVHQAGLARTWSRLKICADDGCAWAFFDHSKNGCSRWCSAETCGNRNKVKRYRERQAQAAAE